MISVNEAREKIKEFSLKIFRSQMVPLENSLGKILYSNVYSPIHQPPFDQAAVDGYAVFLSPDREKTWRVVEEIKAGDSKNAVLGPGEAVRIFTGAMVPQGADAVIMQEHIAIADGCISTSNEVKPGQNIRLKSSQIPKGQLAIEAGICITPASIGFLATLGITEVEVATMPLINLIVTGDELTDGGDELKEGSVYESNSSTVKACLQSVGFELNSYEKVKDDRTLLLSAIKDALQTSDVLLLTGGISVGKYDLVKEALLSLGAEEIFYKVKQKPGKPLFFCMVKDTIVFALPGNPAAVITCFYEYVFPALNMICGKKDVNLKKIALPILKGYPKKAGLSNFLKGKLMPDGVFPLEGQESYILKSFSEADCLIYLPEECENPEVGEMVEVHLLP